MSRTGSGWRGLLLAALAAGACSDREPAPRADAGPRCDAAGARAVVELLGERLKRVALQAPDSVVAREIREAYAPLVTPELLEAWLVDPPRAPGRELSSPWPERIELRSVEPAGDGACLATGEVVYQTSVEATRGGAASRVPVTLRVVEDGGWRVGAYEVATPSPAPPSSPPPMNTSAAAASAADVIRRYYAAIDGKDFRRAYRLWSGDGAASGQSYEEFAAGFAETARVAVEIGEPGRVEGAAGSRYVELAVVVRAVTTGGEPQRFEGRYTLRRSVADGASTEQRRWHLHSADLERTR